MHSAEVVGADHRHGEQLVAALVFLLFDCVLRFGLLEQGLTFLQTVVEITAIHHRQNLVRLHHITFIHEQLLENPLLSRTHVHFLDGLQFAAGGDDSGKGASLGGCDVGREVSFWIPRGKPCQ